MLDESSYETIEEMAEQNYGPREIASFLRVSVQSFMHVWRDTKSRIRESYERGRLEIELKKSEQLKLKVASGSVTAIQIHDKHAEARRFEDIKQQIFGFE